MRNPYFLEEPSCISFSGGRTSGYMLYRILEAHGGTLPEFVRVVFANTGKELPETLDFVQNCSDRWSVNIVWLELSHYERIEDYIIGQKKGGKPQYEHDYKIVNRETASTNGEPFSTLIKGRRYLPNPVWRFCTKELKTRPIKKYLKSLNISDSWLQCIGIRYDERNRAIRLNGKKEGNQEFYTPLFQDKVTAITVGDFWKRQCFDLKLTNNNGVTDWGNCDLCFLKGFKKKISIIKQRPDLVDWWIEQERISTELGINNHAARFRKDQITYKDMKIIATDNNELDFGEDETIPCYCGD